MAIELLTKLDCIVVPLALESLTTELPTSEFTKEPVTREAPPLGPGAEPPPSTEPPPPDAIDSENKVKLSASISSGLVGRQKESC